MYSYFWIDPKSHPPYHKQIRHTRGQFVRMTPPMGIANVPYAVFRNRRSEWLIPEYDLTPQTRAAIAEAEKP